MNRMMKIALGAVMLGFALPVFAQDNFPDVPDNHWAYEAVAALKKAGCLVGYPDGLVRGGRPMSRYEFAAAAYQCWQKMASMHEDLKKQIDECMEMCKNAKGGDTSELQKQLDAIKSQIDGMKGWGSRVADLEKLTKEFEKELASMGVDVKKLRQDLSDLEGRVSELEKHKPAVDIHGTVDFLMLGAHSTDKNFGVTTDGRILGQGRGGGLAGLTRDLSVLHEIAFKINGTNTEGPKWEATIVQGNMLSFGPTALKDALGNMNSGGSGTGFSTRGAGFNAGGSDMYVNTASVTFDSALVGQGFNAKIGRVGYQVGPYIWKRTDYNNYYSNERWDNGDWYFDGGILGFNFGKAGLKVFGGTNYSVTTNNGTPINPSTIDKGKFGSGLVDRTLGLNLEFPVGDMGNINLAYLWQDADFATGVAGGVGKPADRRNTFGGQIDLKFDKFSIWGAYSQTNLSRGTSNVLDNKNNAWDIRGKYDAGNWGAGLGYREVEQNFLADGSWGRLGSVYSPRNIKGFNANIWFKPGQNGMVIWAKGEFDKPKDSTAGDLLAGFDRVDMFKIGLDYPLGTNWNAMLSYEDTKWKRTGGAGDDKERWYTLGVNYGLGANANIMFTYQFSDNLYQGGSALNPAFNLASQKYRGGLFGTQLSVKF